MEGVARTVALAISIPLLVWSLWRMAVMGVRFWQRRRWEPVTATIVDVRTRPGAYESLPLWQEKTLVSYRYRAFEEFYTGVGEFTELAAPIPGETVSVYVHPGRHDRSVLDMEDSRFWRFLSWTVLAAGSASLVVAMLGS